MRWLVLSPGFNFPVPTIIEAQASTQKIGRNEVSLTVSCLWQNVPTWHIACLSVSDSHGLDSLS
ncbi:uncharacterized protein LACBIDRAFT_299822 [Laccaria bicolor S238N-H82]|uniref:Predicted protein n=1 Tax=Laccaria bicolor (strain S238N-H82 / ATCC MYA-4686) TaxID=486041 RepID=B0DFI0_LACBS|nr:uncharacterized protein LACBIDRAFT_299822 [Laccaria bicolor S238N-H82]EDR06866.1 predicted protein [Laccaria bicolor S238N-H82]|eukprot:XP_001882713.1 predicted protein [Laccaria bicolor S238N-H82]